MNAGYTAYKDCSNCDYIEGKKVIPATGHTHIAGVCSCGDDIRETITIDFSKENISNEADANDLAFGNFYINASKGTHTNNSPKYYTSDHSVRIYVGNTLTITSEKFVILNITFTTVSANYSLNNATFTSGTATTTENVTVLTGIYSNFLTLTNANSGNTQMRIVKMVITYYVGEPCEHDAGSEEINVEPTCTENGYTATKCTDCRAEISRIEGEAATGHSYNGVETTAPTCTTTGVMTYTCSACDDSYTEEIAALGHTTETGICDNCREQIGGTIEPDPDPETPNKTIVSMDIFANKGSLVNKVITWTSGGVTVSNAQGSTAIRTEDADHFRVYANSTVTISVNGGKITQVAITCTSNAYATVMETSATNAGYTVTVSGSVVTITVDNADSITFKASAQTRISKVEVTYTAGDESGETECTHANATNEVTRQATCVATGEITYTCECGEEWTEEIPATGEHTYENGTCTSCGADDPNAGGSTPAEPTTLATFELGTATTDSNSATSTYKEEDGDYTLSITGSKMYTGYGNNQSGLKFGSSSAKGSAEFTVSGNITKVVIYVCKYSSDSTKITVNGTEYTLTSEYQAIEIKQPTENTEWKVSIEAVNASKNRFYMHQIEFIGYAE